MEFLAAYESVEKDIMDRYHIRFNTGDEWVMSKNANSSQGVCYYNGLFHFSQPANCFEISLDDLPSGVKQQIDYLEGG